MRVLEARSAFTISVLRINAIPTNKLSINEKFSFKPVFVERQDHKEIFSTGNGDAINSLISNITSSLDEYHLSLHTTREAVSLLHFQHRHETLEVMQVLQKHLHCDVFHKEGKKHSTCRLTRITNNFSPSFWIQTAPSVLIFSFLSLSSLSPLYRCLIFNSRID